MKRTYLLIAMLLVMGMTGCGKEASKAEMTTQEQITESVASEQTEDIVTEVTTTEQSEASATEVTAEQSEATTEEEVVPSDGEVSTEIALEDQTGTLTPDQALKLIEETLGSKDEETGNAYTFGHINTMTVDGVEYHVFMWGWLVDDHVSKLTDLFVATDGSAIYEGTFLEGATTVYTETNFLE